MVLAQIFYPRDKLGEYNCSHWQLIKMGFMQKILGFNREVPWPVHFTSQVSSYKNIVRAVGTSPIGASSGNYIQAMNGIELGKGLLVAPGVKIISANHNLEDFTLHDSAPPIVIEDYCWIGANAVILPGVHLGKRTIVGAGAVVTKSFEEGNCVIAGNPARVLRRL